MAQFLRNCWYMAAWSHEIGEVPLRRRLLGDPVALYRKGDGSVAALVDRCPHRFAPLSMGTRDGDALVCPYHGLTFDAGGACIRNPYSAVLPKGAKVRSFPTAERDGIVWFWPGEGEPDAGAIPDFAMLTIPTHGAPITGYMPMAAPYEMGIDNLLDLSHIEWVHKGSFAGNGVIFAGEHSLQQDGSRLQSNWWMTDVPAPPHTYGIYDPAMRCDHWLDMRWDAPSAMYLQVGACPHGADRADNPAVAHQAHILTPETEGSTHYFWATTRAFPPSVEGDAMLHGLLSQAFDQEDKPIIEATYANMDGRDFWDLKPAYLGIDAGGTTARRVLAKLIAAEGEGA